MGFGKFCKAHYELLICQIWKYCKPPQTLLKSLCNNNIQEIEQNDSICNFESVASVAPWRKCHSGSKDYWLWSIKILKASLVPARGHSL